MNKFLITGGAGYVGSNLAQNLAYSGFAVRVLDNFSVGSRADLEKKLAPYAERVEIVEGDVLDGAACRKALEGITHVLHFASLNGVEESIPSPAKYMQINVQGTASLLEAARVAQGLEKFVLASSCAVYGETPAMSKHEAGFADPISPFAVSKMAAEALCRSFYKLHDFPAVSLRFFNPYGPIEDVVQPTGGVLAAFRWAVSHGQPCTLHGNGEQTRDFVYIDDVVEACIAACNAPARLVCGHAFNVGTGMRVSLNEAIAAVEKLVGRTVVAEREALREGDIRHSRADVTKAAGMLQFTAAVSFEDGLCRMFADGAAAPTAKAA